MLAISNLLGNEHVDDISFVHINCNDCDDLASQNWSKIFSDSVDKVLNANKNEVKVVLHSALATSFEFFECSCNTFCPHDLCSQKCNLFTVILKPLMAFLFKFPKISSLFSNFENISKRVLHLSFNVAKVVFDGTNASEGVEERYILSVL